MHGNILELSPHVRIQLCRDGEYLRGFGEITVDGMPIRSAAVVFRPDFSTCDAIHYQDFLLDEIVTGDERTILRTRAVGRPEVLSNDAMDQYDWNIAFPQVREGVEDRLDWILTPQSLDLDGEQYHGFSLGFCFVSEAREIHRFFTYGTWEIGGRATGNTIYHQSQVAEPVYTAAPDTHYTTACLIRLDLWHHPRGNSYQFSPRWASMQAFDFQSADQGALLGYWRDPHSVKSLIQKNPGEEVVFCLDEYDFELAGEVEIPAKHILFSAADTPRERHDVVNMWTRAMEYTGDIIRGFFGIELCHPMPSGGPHFEGRVHISRAEFEAADEPQDDWLWREEDGKFYFMLEGDKIESHDLLYWQADKVLPRLKAQGIRRLSIGQPVHESDFTELAFAYHAQTGWHGDIYVASVCGSHRYVPAEFYGGWDAWRYLAKAAKKLDLSLGHWIGFHLTPRAAILRDHPEYLVTHAHTKSFGGGYGHQCICAINWRSGARDWFLDDLRRWHEEGLDWLWFDSWPNLACLSLNYADRMAPMQAETPKVLAELQQIGYNWFGFEGTSPFGVPAYGLADPMRDYEGHVQQGVCGQNDFGKRIGHEYLALNEGLLHINFNDERSLDDLPEWSFRYIANRSLNVVTDTDRATYLALLPLMRKRYLLPNDRGVRWEGGDGQEVLFAYRPFAHAVPAGARVTKVVGTEETSVSCPENSLQAEPRTAYRIEPAG